MRYEASRSMFTTGQILRRVAADSLILTHVTLVWLPYNTLVRSNDFGCPWVIAASVRNYCDFKLLASCRSPRIWWARGGWGRHPCCKRPSTMW